VQASGNENVNKMPRIFGSGVFMFVKKYKNINKNTLTNKKHKYTMWCIKIKHCMEAKA